MISTIGKNIYRRMNVRLALRGNVEYSPDLRVGVGTILKAPDRLRIGRKVVIGAYSTIACNGTIGDGALISSQVGIVGRYDHDHKAIGHFFTEAPWIYAESARAREDRDRIVIEDDVWIGHGAIVLTGLVVGRGSIVAAGAVVIRDIPRYSIVAGNPAKIVGERFTSEEIGRHEQQLYGAV